MVHHFLFLVVPTYQGRSSLLRDLVPVAMAFDKLKVRLATDSRDFFGGGGFPRRVQRLHVASQREHRQTFSQSEGQRALYVSKTACQELYKADLSKVRLPDGSPIKMKDGLEAPVLVYRTY